jgi:hypothetical protein
MRLLPKGDERQGTFDPHSIRPSSTPASLRWMQRSRNTVTDTN